MQTVMLTHNEISQIDSAFSCFPIPLCQRIEHGQLTSDLRFGSWIADEIVLASPLLLGFLPEQTAPWPVHGNSFGAAAYRVSRPSPSVIERWNHGCEGKTGVMWEMSNEGRWSMDFIERLFGIAPDGGSGMLEILLFALPISGVLYLTYLRRRPPQRNR